MRQILQVARVLAVAALVAAPLACPVPTTAAANATTVRSQATTYNVRLEAHYFGQVVDTWDVTFQAASEFEFRNAVGDAQRVFAQSLDQRKVKWNRITFVVLGAV